MSSVPLTAYRSKMIHNDVIRSAAVLDPVRTTIRPYRATDLRDIYEISVRTAEAGGDARGIYCDDDLMPDLFAGPYLHLEPELAFVLDDGGRAVGYVLGTADTPRFVQAYRRVWIPRLTPKYPAPPPTSTTRDEQAFALHHDPERLLVPELRDYPAHLHINVLPSYQGGGHGRGLIDVFLDALATRGVPALHITPLTVNASALAFYYRYGFHDIPVADPGLTSYLGIRTPSR
ncbi:MAG: hypothetical protein QG622_2935 [Actinomycetota bacterium]|nr:hypothetical protein [Actinomycetota bacterium]